MEEKLKDIKCCVYKYVFDEEIIYIGMTGKSLMERIHAHSGESKFYKYKGAKIYYVEFVNKAEAEGYEKLLINKYKPVLNVQDKYDTDSHIELILPEWTYYCDHEIFYDKCQSDFKVQCNKSVFSLIPTKVETCTSQEYYKYVKRYWESGILNYSFNYLKNNEIGDNYRLDDISQYKIEINVPSQFCEINVKPEVQFIDFDKDINTYIKKNQINKNLEIKGMGSSYDDIINTNYIKSDRYEITITLTEELKKVLDKGVYYTYYDMMDAYFRNYLMYCDRKIETKINDTKIMMFYNENTVNLITEILDGLLNIIVKISANIYNNSIDKLISLLMDQNHFNVYTSVYSKERGLKLINSILDISNIEYPFRFKKRCYDEYVLK